MFDTVPRGAGNVLRIAAAPEETIRAGLARVMDCECGPETACYACLRGYRNQRYHDELSRGAASSLLNSLLAI
jgi:hypothetical protein